MEQILNHVTDAVKEDTHQAQTPARYVDNWGTAAGEMVLFSKA